MALSELIPPSKAMRKLLHRPELAGGDEDRDLGTADDTFEIAAEVAFGEIRVFAAFADDD